MCVFISYVLVCAFLFNSVTEYNDVFFDLSMDIYVYDMHCHFPKLLVSSHGLGVYITFRLSVFGEAQN